MKREREKEREVKEKNRKSGVESQGLIWLSCDKKGTEWGPT